MSELLRVQGLKTYFVPSGNTVVKAVDGVSFRIDPGETLGVVGESGCGKSVTALSLMRLIPNPPGRIVGGSVHFQGQDLLQKTEAQMRAMRGNDIAMIFQEPMTSLNPVFSCGMQIAEAIQLHQGLKKREAMARTIEMMALVGIPEPQIRAGAYPHQLSGGMRQRVMIAMALSCHPKLLIADEPTTALDVTIQAQILDLLARIKRELGMAIMLITHDLGVVAEMATRVIVMYAGKIVEESDTISLFRNPLHPYTEGLLRSIPRIKGPRGKLHVITGQIPDPARLPLGCSFGPRCTLARDVCRHQEPNLVHVGSNRMVRCWVRAEKSREETA